MTVYFPIKAGVPARLVVRAEVLFDRARGMYVRIATSSGEVGVVCDGVRAWTMYSQCTRESSCDEAVRRWFDIGWGYAELARLVGGEEVRTPGWTARQRNGERRQSTPTSAMIMPDDQRTSPGAAVGWMSSIPDRVDLEPVLARARAMPACP